MALIRIEPVRDECLDLYYVAIYHPADAEQPFVTTEPPIAEIWATFTVILAVVAVEVANTLRDTDEYGGIVRSKAVNFENCKNDAVPPVG